MNGLTLAYVLIGVGALFLLAELLIPTGVLFVMGLISIAGGVALSFIHGQTSTGFITLIVVLIAFPLAISVGLWLYPKLPMGSQVLTAPVDDVTVASMPGNTELEKYRGRIGKTVSPMRPSGVVEFDGKRVDCITEGIMLDVDLWVKCIDVKPGKVIVRQVEQPKMRDFEATDFG
jgi:membrane-bound serine protease (ClpP class)